MKGIRPISTLIATNQHEMELRECTNPKQVWPGYDIPLKRTGYWFGSFESHRLVSRQEILELGFFFKEGELK